MPPNTNQPDQYDFIMNPGSQQKPPMKFGNSMASRIFIVLGGLLVLIIIFAVAASFIGKGSQEQTNRLLKVFQSQTELIRVSALGKEKAQDIGTKNLAANTWLSTQSSLVETKALLNKRGVNEKTLEKSLVQDPVYIEQREKADAALETAAKNNKYDEKLVELLELNFEQYNASLTAAFENGSEAEKEALNSAYASVGVLNAKKEL